MKNIIEKYFTAFNNGNYQGMIDLLHPSIEHDINQGQTKVGILEFKKFLAHMEDCYKESLENILIMDAGNGKNFSAEFTVVGEYLKTDGDLPKANGQKYKIRAGSFFEIENSKIKRVTTYYNLPLWIDLVK
jgi:steroid delta-isomerase-like uncharacterized protein